MYSLSRQLLKSRALREEETKTRKKLACSLNSPFSLRYVLFNL